MAKKLLVIVFLVVSVALAFTSCDHNNENGNNGPETSTHTHSFGDWQTTEEATCKEEGKRVRSCSICAEIEEEFVSKSETHTVVTDRAVSATCKDTGLTEGSHCSVCNKVIVAQTIVAKTEDHTIVTDAAVAATCKNTGLTEGSHCSACNKVLVAQTTLPTTTHSYKDGICSVCNQNQPSNFVPDYASGQVNTIGTDKASSNYTSQADWIYFTSSQRRISKFKKTASSATVVYEATSGVVRCVNVVGDWIYFYVEGDNTANSYIAKVRTDGSKFEKILTSVTVGEMLVIKDTIFFTIIKNPYNDYAKDCAPLYMISVNGGISKQLHDGYVLSITADNKYVYFLHIQKSGASTIYRMKHDGTAKTSLLSRSSSYNLNYIVLANSNLYFIEKDRYSDEDEYLFCSITVNGGSYTTYGKTCYMESFTVSGSTAYYFGNPYGNYLDYGIIKYDFKTDTHSLFRTYETHGTFECRLLLNCLIVDNCADWDKYFTLKSIPVYDLQTKAWRTITVE